jgi:flavin-dependent dehydrogenase
MKPCLEGFLVIGDALCHFNPIYAQGMSAAAKQAEILREILSDRATQSSGLGGTRLGSQVNGAIWLILH